MIWMASGMDNDGKGWLMRGFIFEDLIELMFFYRRPLVFLE